MEKPIVQIELMKMSKSVTKFDVHVTVFGVLMELALINPKCAME